MVVAVTLHEPPEVMVHVALASFKTNAAVHFTLR